MERSNFLETVNTQDTEANKAPVFVHTFHEGIVVGGLLVARGVRKPHFQVIGVESNFHFVGHRFSPAFGWPVK